MRIKLAQNVQMAVLVFITFAVPVYVRIAFNAPPQVLNIIFIGTLILLFMIPRWFIFWMMLVVSWVVIFFTEMYSSSTMPPMVSANASVLSNGLLLFLVTFYRIKTYRTLIHFKNLSNKDSLTNLFNRRYFDRYIQSFFREERKQGVHSIILCDIDHFKYINDKYGHLAGDIVISNVAKILDTCVYEKKLLARFGGDELIIFLPYIDTEHVNVTAEVIRKEVEKHSILVEGNLINVTLSLGIATFHKYNELTKTINKADQAMYQAKTQGRNRVVKIEEA